jgi:magnesium chelatase family protein
VQEARERVRSAIRNSGYEFPLRRITVNLAPTVVRLHYRLLWFAA